MRFSWLYHHLDYLRSIRLDARNCHAHLFATLALSKLPKLKREASSVEGEWVRRESGNNGQCWSSLPWLLQWIAFWAALVAAASHSSPPPFSLSPLLPPEHLELVAAQTIRQLLFWRVKQHRRTNVEHSALQQRQRGSLRARKRAREVRVHRRCPFARNIIRLIWSSLKLWSISRFTAPKCRKFAHSFGSLVGNLSKSIIHIYMYIVLYTILYIYIFKCLQALPRLLFTFIKPSQATANWQCKVFSFLLAVAIIKVNGAKSAE